MAVKSVQGRSLILSSLGNIIFLCVSLIPYQGWGNISVALFADEYSHELRVFLELELSKETGVVVYDREYLPDSIDENFYSRLQELNARNQLVGVDGIISCWRDPLGGDYYITLTSVSSGLVVAGFKERHIQSKLLEQAQKIKGRIVNGLPLLALTESELVRLSVVSLRSTFSLPGSDARDEAMRSGLQRLLEIQPGFLVSDRTNLSELVLENHLRGEAEKFQAGQWLLDGQVGQQGEQLTIDIRLQNLATHKEQVLSSSGSIYKQGELLESLAKKISETLLELDVSDAAFDIKKEAERFAEEAYWLYQAGNFSSAITAGETAMALGGNSWSAWEFLVRSYIQSAFPRSGRHNPFFFSGQYSKGWQDRIESVALAAELYVDTLSRFPDRQEIPNNWRGLGVDLVGFISMALKLSHENGAIPLKNQSVDRLRKSILRLKPWVEPKRNDQFKEQLHYTKYVFDFAKYWHDSIDELFRDYIHAGMFNQEGLERLLGSEGEILSSWISPNSEFRRKRAVDFIAQVKQPESSLLKEIMGLHAELAEVKNEQREGIVDQNLKEKIIHYTRRNPEKDGLHRIIRSYLRRSEERAFSGDEDFWCEILNNRLANANALEPSFLVEMACPYGFHEDHLEILQATFSQYLDRMHEQIQNYSSPDSIRLYIYYFAKRLNLELSSASDKPLNKISPTKSWVLSVDADRRVPQLMQYDAVSDSLWRVSRKMERPVYDELSKVPLRGGKMKRVRLPKDETMSGFATDLSVSSPLIGVVAKGRQFFYNSETLEWVSWESSDLFFKTLHLNGDELYSGFNQNNFSGIEYANLKTGEKKVIASSRRRPSQSALDDVSPYEVISLMPDSLQNRDALGVVFRPNERPHYTVFSIANQAVYTHVDLAGHIYSSLSQRGSLHFRNGKALCIYFLEGMSENVRLSVPFLMPLLDGEILAREDTESGIWLLIRSWSAYTPVHSLMVIRKHDYSYETVPLHLPSAFTAGGESERTWLFLREGGVLVATLANVSYFSNADIYTEIGRKINASP